MRQEVIDWYNSFSESEQKSYKSALENFMLMRDKSELDATWEKLLESKYSEFIRNQEWAARQKKLKEQEAAEREEQRQYDLSRGIYTLVLSSSNKYKVWVAEIIGVDGKYGFKRRFINKFDTKGSSDVYRLEEGKYYNYLAGGVQYFSQVVNAELVDLTKEQMVDIISNF